MLSDTIVVEKSSWWGRQGQWGRRGLFPLGMLEQPSVRTRLPRVPVELQFALLPPHPKSNGTLSDFFGGVVGGMLSGIHRLGPILVSRLLAGEGIGADQQELEDDWTPPQFPLQAANPLRTALGGVPG